MPDRCRCQRASHPRLLWMCDRDFHASVASRETVSRQMNRLLRLDRFDIGDQPIDSSIDFRLAGRRWSMNTANRTATILKRQSPNWHVAGAMRRQLLRTVDEVANLLLGKDRAAIFRQHS